MITLQILQSIPDNENVGVVSVLIAIISGLTAAFVYIYRELKVDLKEKDAKIEEITKNHQLDLKEGIDDYKEMIDKYYLLFERVKDWQDARTRRV
jgi:hypothetical protein